MAQQARDDHLMNNNKLALAQLFLLLVLCPVFVSSLNTTTTTTDKPTSTIGRNTTTIRLGVFMESLCPDTRRFFRDQLVPTQRLIGDIIDIDLVPFGHARVLGNGKMLCQHGAKECEGNRRMACILARSKNQTEIVETFGCLLKLNSSPKDCVTNNMANLSFDELETCTTGDESYQLMIAAEKESGRLGYVPHLEVDGKSSNEIQDQAENNLKDYMCKLYTGLSPPEPCKGDTQQTAAADASGGGR